MCAGGEIAALALAAGGTAVSMSASQRAERERKQALLTGINEEAGIQDRANKRTDRYVEETFDPTKRLANYETEAATKEASLGELLAKQAAAGQGEITASTTGALSDAYTRQKASATAASTAKSRTLAKLLSRSGAAGGLYGNEALKGADYSSDMLGFGTESAMNRNMTNVNAGAAGSAGNDLALLGGLLSGSAGIAAGVGRRTPAVATTERNW